MLEILAREQLPYLFEQHKLKGVGAEIGVYRAHFTAQIFSVWTGSIYCVDSWGEYVPGLDMTNAYLDAISRLGVYPYQIINLDSVEASKTIKDGELDWVYIDADHSYEGVVRDLEAWAPKVRSGGILSGHDYLDGYYCNCQFGVKSAVDEFVRKNGLALNVTSQDAPYDGIRFVSWWCTNDT